MTFRQQEETRPYKNGRAQSLAIVQLQYADRHSVFR